MDPSQEGYDGCGRSMSFGNPRARETMARLRDGNRILKFEIETPAATRGTAGSVLSRSTMSSGCAGRTIVPGAIGLAVLAAAAIGLGIW